MCRRISSSRTTPIRSEDYKLTVESIQTDQGTVTITNPNAPVNVNFASRCHDRSDDGGLTYSAAAYAEGFGVGDSLVETAGYTITDSNGVPTSLPSAS